MRFSLALASIATLFAGAQAQNLVEVVASVPELSTLATAVGLAGRTEALSSDGPFTVFAPTDNAFGTLPPGILDRLILPPWVVHLRNVIDYHVVAGAGVESGELTEGQILDMYNGEETTISLNPVTVNGINVTTPDVIASNGVAHVINDGVLLPSFVGKTVVDVAVEANLTLATLVVEAGLDGVLSNASSSFTVFAPTNEAFGELEDYIVDYLLSEDGKDTLVKILTYHVLGVVVPAELIEEGVTTVTTVEGSEVNITNTGGSVMVKDADVVDTDILAINGIIHFIDKVIIPDDVDLSVITPSPTMEPSGAMSISAIFGIAATLLAVVAL